MPAFKTATCVQNLNPVSTFHLVTFRTEEPFDYQVGQYVSCKVAAARMNSYSIAGSHLSHTFELLVDVKPGGPGSQFFAQIKPGEPMPFIGPTGKFVLNFADGSNELIFLATGSGIAPIRDMLETVLVKQHYTQKVILYFGLRYQSDVILNYYFDHLQQIYANFRFKLVLSQPEPNWQGAVGHITEFFDDDYASTAQASAYLCGNGKMIAQAKERLLTKGTPENHIYHEKFF